MLGEKDRKDLKIGIVMPVHNCLRYSQETIQSLHCSYEHWWFIIDNASDDDTQRYFEQQIENPSGPYNLIFDEKRRLDGPIAYIRHEENTGVPRSWNEGITLAFDRGCDLVLVINNDIVFAEDTVDNLIAWWTGEQIFTVTNVGNDPKYLETYKRKKLITTCPTFIGFLIDEGTIRRVGWFGEDFKTGYFEDKDYIKRCEAEGVPVMAALNAPVAHYGSRAIKEGNVQHEPHFTENLHLFEKKHGFTPGFVPKDKKRLLWVGDAGGCQTGFGRVSSNVLEHLSKIWDVHVLGLNYNGDPHIFPYPIYTASSGGDWKGLGRYADIVRRINPAIVVANNDFYIILDYLEIHKEFHERIPFVGYMPVDGKNIRYDWMEGLNDLDLAILYTQFGVDEFREAGFKGQVAVIPHGIDLSIYYPVDKFEARRKLGLDSLADGFIIGNVNNDQMRKRQDLTVEYFCKWVKEYDIPENVYFYFHCKSEGRGWDIQQLFQYWGQQLYGDRESICNTRFIATGFDIMAARGISQKEMKYVYSSLDLQVTTTMGEGFGLTQIEGMACGVPQICPDWSALGEWAAPAARMVPITSLSVSPGNLNAIGGVVDREGFIKALNDMYNASDERITRSKRGLDLVNNPRFQWEPIANMFDLELRSVLDSQNIPESSKEIPSVVRV